MDAASCTCKLNLWSQEPGEVKGSKAASSAGQSGKLAPCSSTTFTCSPFRTATLANFPKPSMRRCLITNNPGSITSNTKQTLGTLRVAPQTCSSPGLDPDF